jgi:hypothetical protein
MWLSSKLLNTRCGGDLRNGSEARSRNDAALAIWNAAGPANGTLVDSILRGIHLPPPSTFAFTADLLP